mgnify:CR=1 FL=1
MLVGLIGGTSYVQILYAYYYPFDYEIGYALWVITFVAEDKGEVLLLVVMWIRFSFDNFDKMYVV